MNSQAKPRLAQLLKQLWQDECGAIISADLILTISLLFGATIIGVFIIRNCVLIVFMGVAVDISAEQTHTFDTLDRFVDTDADGFRGYAVLTTFDFDTTYPDLGTDPDELDNNEDMIGEG